MDIFIPVLSFSGTACGHAGSTCERVPVCWWTETTGRPSRRCWTAHTWSQLRTLHHHPHRHSRCPAHQVSQCRVLDPLLHVYIVSCARPSPACIYRISACVKRLAHFCSRSGHFCIFLSHRYSSPSSLAQQCGKWGEVGRRRRRRRR